MLLAGEDELEVVAELDRGGPVIAFLECNTIDLVLLDINLPDMNGMDLLAEIVGIHRLPTVVLTGQNDPREFAFALRMGAKGIVQKADPPGELLAALRAARHNQLFLSSGVAGQVETPMPTPVALSPRQEAIMRYLVRGESNKEISYKLGLATPTISFHIGEIRKKLGAKSNRQIVEAARKANLID